MSVIEVQPTGLPSSFPVLDTRPPPPVTYLSHSHQDAQYLDGSQSSKENKTPPPTDNSGEYQSVSSQSSLSQQAVIDVPKHVNGQLSPQTAFAGKKRSADGQVKEIGVVVQEASKLTSTGHSRKSSTLSNASSTNMTEVSTRPLHTIYS